MSGIFEPSDSRPHDFSGRFIDLTFGLDVDSDLDIDAELGRRRPCPFDSFAFQVYNESSDEELHEESDEEDDLLYLDEEPAEHRSFLGDDGRIYAEVDCAEDDLDPKAWIIWRYGVEIDWLDQGFRHYPALRRIADDYDYRITSADLGLDDLDMEIRMDHFDDMDFGPDVIDMELHPDPFYDMDFGDSMCRPTLADTMDVDVFALPIREKKRLLTEGEEEDKESRKMKNWRARWTHRRVCRKSIRHFGIVGHYFHGSFHAALELESFH